MRQLKGWGHYVIRKEVVRLYRVDPGDYVHEWLYRGRKPRFRLRTFKKALWYHEACRMALRLERRHPEWGCNKTATEVSKHLPIHVPKRRSISG